MQSNGEEDRWFWIKLLANCLLSCSVPSFCPRNLSHPLQLAKCGQARQLNMTFAIAESIYLICLPNVSQELENEKLKPSV